MARSLSVDLEKELVSLETRFWQSMKERDTEAALRLTADPCLVTGGQGVGRLDHATFAGMMDNATWVLKDFTFSDVKVERVSDDVAVIAYKVKENLTVDGKPLSFQAADASTWVRKGDGWVCVLHTESVLGDPFGRDRKPAA
jgi:hypothetical protein